jgi:hypothetical protein
MAEGDAVSFACIAPRDVAAAYFSAALHRVERDRSFAKFRARSILYAIRARPRFLVERVVGIRRVTTVQSVNLRIDKVKPRRALQDFINAGAYAALADIC